MAANSKHYGDVYIWINKVIESCISVGHTTATRKLIENFNKLSNEHILSLRLNNALEKQYWKILDGALKLK